MAGESFRSLELTRWEGAVFHTRAKRKNKVMNLIYASKKPKIFLSGLIATLMLLPLLLYGCASESRLRKLDDTLKVYSDTIRWGRYEDAAQLVLNKPTFNKKTLDNIKVTSYKERQRDIDENSTLAKTVVEIRYYNEEIGKEHTLVDKQEWTYFEESEAWLLTSDMPDFGADQ